VPAIVGQYSEAVAEGSGANEKVKVADGLALGSEPATLTTEDSFALMIVGDTSGGCLNPPCPIGLRLAADGPVSRLGTVLHCGECG